MLETETLIFYMIYCRECYNSFPSKKKIEDCRFCNSKNTTSHWVENFNKGKDKVK